MQMNSVVIRTDDMEKSLQFYEKVLGLTFESMMSAARVSRSPFCTILSRTVGWS